MGEAQGLIRPQRWALRGTGIGALFLAALMGISYTYIQVLNFLQAVFSPNTTPNIDLADHFGWESVIGFAAVLLIVSAMAWPVALLSGARGHFRSASRSKTL